MGGGLYPRFRPRLTETAPQLRVFHFDLRVDSILDALPLLRNEPPYEALRLCHLKITEPEPEDDYEHHDDADVLELVEAVQGHASLHQLSLANVSLRTPAVLGALVAAALVCGLSTLSFNMCGLSPAALPALVQLLRSTALTSLTIQRLTEPLLDTPVAAQLADAIAANRLLLKLDLRWTGFWLHDAPAAAIMRALTGHPSLQELHLGGNHPPHPTAAGAALGALIAADAPALRELNICGSQNLGDAGMRPVLDALAQNTHLRVLDCCDTGMSVDFACDVFLPAVRVNTGLRTLKASAYWDGVWTAWAPPAVLEAEALVAARTSVDADLI